MKSSYKDFLFAVTNSLIDCKEGGVPYAICDIAKKVEYLLPVPKEPESIKRLEDYNKTLIKNYAKNTVLKKLQALDDYERSILEEVYEKYCMPEVYKQIVNDIVIDSGISKNSDNQQKLNAVADFMLEKHRNRETRQWLQAVVRYKADNGYEKYLFRPEAKEQEKGNKQKRGRIQRDNFKSL